MNNFNSRGDQIDDIVTPVLSNKMSFSLDQGKEEKK
jgi:hypothetical protein